MNSMQNIRQKTNSPAIVLAACLAVLTSAGLAEARVTRSCTTEIYLSDVEVEIDGVWVDAGDVGRLDAGHIVFSASAGGFSPNLARMRASRKAEACIDDWYRSDLCVARARSTSWGDDYTGIDIHSVMNESICEDIVAQGLDTLLRRRIRGRLHAKIDGNRCCKDSSRDCPYAYGQSRMGRFDSWGLAGKELWPDYLWYFQCGLIIYDVIFPEWWQD